MKVSKKEIQKFQQKEQRVREGHAANNVELVQDRKTGEFYNPKQAFDQMMNKPEILAVFKRLAVR
jgi:hypothetical protein